MTGNKFKLTAMIATGFFMCFSGAANAQSTVQFANTHDFESGKVLDGGGSLTRTSDEVWAQLALAGLDKKAAYTFWWVVFNNPEDCVGELQCGLDDLGNPSVMAQIIWAGGFITGTDGTANVSAHLSSAGAPEGADVLLLPEDPLEPVIELLPGNGFDAEIHLIVRTHGARIAGSVDLQIGSVIGACDVNTCTDQQAIAFLANPPE